MRRAIGPYRGRSVPLRLESGKYRLNIGRRRPYINFGYDWTCLLLRMEFQRSIGHLRRYRQIRTDRDPQRSHHRANLLRMGFQRRPIQQRQTLRMG